MASSTSSKPKIDYISTRIGELDSRVLVDHLEFSERASALFKFLYNGGKENLKGSNYELTVPAFGRAVGDHYVPTKELARIPNPDPRSPFSWTLKPGSQYLPKLKNIIDNYEGLGIFVDQRAFGVSTAESKRRFIGTFVVQPCIVVLLYDRARTVAALSHFDEAQNYGSIADIIDAADFHGRVVEVHFYGGCTDAGAVDGLSASSNTSTKAFEELLNASAKFDVKLVICSFNVLARTHGRAITFDPEDGSFYGQGTAAIPQLAAADCRSTGDLNKKRQVMQQPLDSKFRMWPNGEYLVSADGRTRRQS
jgi:hypothetical protein